MKLQGEKVLLRAMEPSDIELLSEWENDTDTWVISNTLAPFSRFVLEEYIASSHQDIYTAKQLRLMIETVPRNDGEGKTIGCIDLFDFDPSNQRAGVGILIANNKDRGKGYAKDALFILIKYCFHTLNLHQVYCNILQDNDVSIALFKQQGFEVVGLKKAWIRVGKEFKDEYILQRIKE